MEPLVFKWRNTNCQYVNEKRSVSLVIRELQIKTTLRVFPLAVELLAVDSWREGVVADRFARTH